MDDEDTQEKPDQPLEKNKFVGQNRISQTNLQPVPKPQTTLPPELRKAAKILGLEPSEITIEAVHKAWREQIKSANVHPDLGGEPELAILLNTAKDSLIKWFESRSPKLGKQFPPPKT